MRRRSEKYRWSSSPVLESACATATRWLRLWNGCEKPKTVVVNTVQIYSKRIFRNAVQEHVVTVRSVTAEKIINDPTYLWKSRPLSGKSVCIAQLQCTNLFRQ